MFSQTHQSEENESDEELSNPLFEKVEDILQDIMSERKNPQQISINKTDKVINEFAKSQMMLCFEEMLRTLPNFSQIATPNLTSLSPETLNKSVNQSNLSDQNVADFVFLVKQAIEEGKIHTFDQLEYALCRITMQATNSLHKLKQDASRKFATIEQLTRQRVLLYIQTHLVNDADLPPLQAHQPRQVKKGVVRVQIIPNQNLKKKKGKVVGSSCDQTEFKDLEQLTLDQLFELCNELEAKKEQNLSSLGL